MKNKLLKNVAYEATDLVGEVIKITNNHMDFYRPARTGWSKFVNMKSSVKKWSYDDLMPFALEVGTKWLIWEVRGSNDDEVLIANFREPNHHFWISLNELERSARLL